MTPEFSYVVLAVLAIKYIPATTAWYCYYSPYNTLDCSCQDGVLQCRDLSELPLLDPDYEDMDFWYTEYHTAIFEGGNITSIPNKTLANGLKTLRFVGHPLTNISLDAFQAFATTLNTLSITGAKFQTLPEALLSLTNLTSLEISETPIEDWEVVRLTNIADSVRILILDNVSLSVWPSWLSFSKPLEELSLRQNSLKSIPDNVVESAHDSLRSLNLEQNNLTYVLKLVSNLNVLQSLVLSGNNLMDLNSATGLQQLASLPFTKSLTILELASTGLTTMQNLSNFRKLAEIDLSNNQIAEANTGSFPALLVKLQLQGNRLTSVPSSLVTMLNLTDLDMSHNLLPSVSLDMFSRYLKYLDLSYNKIVVVTAPVITGLIDPRPVSFLETLHLEHNPLVSIGQLSLNIHILLQELYLDGTSLNEIPVGLARLWSLRTLGLENVTTMACTCPPARELVECCKYSTFLIDARCSNKQSVLDYLKTVSCPTTVTTRTTRLTTTQSTQSTSSMHTASRTTQSTMSSSTPSTRTPNTSQTAPATTSTTSNTTTELVSETQPDRGLQTQPFTTQGTTSTTGRASCLVPGIFNAYGCLIVLMTLLTCCL